MVRSARLVIVIVALCIRGGTCSNVSEDDKSFGCARFCLKGSGDMQMKNYFDILKIGEKDSAFFNNICEVYSDLERCLNRCPDGQEKSYVTELFGALKDACSKSELPIIGEIAFFFHSKPFTFQCRTPFQGAEWQEFLKNSYSAYRNDCAEALGFTKIVLECELFNCYINETSSLIVKKPELSANGAEIWKKLIRGMIQPALTRRFDYCYIPEEMVPKACKEIMCNGEGRSNVSVFSVVIAVTVLMMRFMSG